jgi:hypothetical protein
MRKRPAGDAKRQHNAKKMLNRRNELKDLLETQDLAVFRAKNELKTNSLLSAKEADQSEKPGFRIRDSGARRHGSRLRSGSTQSRIQDSGFRSQESRLTTQERVRAKRWRRPASPSIGHVNFPSAPTRSQQLAGSSQREAQGTQRPQRARGGRTGLRHQLATAGCAAIDFYVSAPGDQEHGGWGRWTNSLSSEGQARRNSSKLNERTGNVFENKGTVRETPQRSLNVTENKPLIRTIRECH